MSIKSRLIRQSILTGLANILFASGVVLLFVAIYKQNRGAILATAIVVLALTIATWFAAAYAPQGDDPKRTLKDDESERAKPEAKWKIGGKSQPYTASAICTLQINSAPTGLIA